MRLLLALSIVVSTSCLVLAADAPNTTAERVWTLESGSNRLELTRVGDAIFLTQLGPEGTGRLDNSPIIFLSADGKGVEATDWRLEEVRSVRDANADVPILEVRIADPERQLACVVRYSAWGDTGVFTSDVHLVNRGQKPVRIGDCTSLFLELPAGGATLRYLDSPGSNERHLTTVPLKDELTQIDNDKLGRSTRNISTWWSLYLPELDLSYTSQLAYSGNWKAQFTAPHDSRRDVRFGMTFDNDGQLQLAAGATFDLPRAAITVSQGPDLGPAVRALHRFQRSYVLAKQPANDPLLVEFNTWYALHGDITAENVTKLIPLAAEIGCEAFVIDANWHVCPKSGANWQENLGDWVVNKQKFPDGLAPIIKSVHDHGMRFGVWLEPEVASLTSNTLREHPDWFLTKGGKTVIAAKRAHLDYAIPEVRQHMHSVIDNLMKEGQIDWVKFDYNVDIGGEFDSVSDARTNTRLHDHLAGYYQWLDELSRKYPDLIIESCSGGGKRFDLGMIGHTHTTWISDAVNPRYSVQIAWGALVEFPPDICNHWMIGDVRKDRRSGVGNISSTDPTWWDFMFRVAMNGQFGISSRLDLWPAAALERAKENIQLYKRIRGVIHGAEVYHLTEAPAAGFNPQGWMGLQYVQPDRQQAVLLAFRLGNSEANHRFRLQGLDSEKTYAISADGRSVGNRSGKLLATDGIEVQLDESWRCVVIELSADTSASAVNSDDGSAGSSKPLLVPDVYDASPSSEPR